jgi:uncharacterized protein (DUF885 family)
MSLLSRRTFLLSSAAAGLAACTRTPPAGPAGTSAAAAARAVYDAAFEQMLAIAPETATALGLDTGARAGLKHRLTDRARWGRIGWWAPLIEALPRLRAIDADALPLRERAWRDTAIWYAERAAESRSIPYGGGQTPYVITQLYGSYISVPNFLDTQHSIEAAADADAYLDRLDAFHRNIDAEVAMAQADAAAGVVPPAIIIDKALQQTRSLLAERGAESGIVRSLARRTREKNLAGDWEARAVRIVDGPIAAALRRQEAMLAGLRSGAGDQAGVSRLPQGRALYAQTLRYFTSTDMSAEAVHRLGLDEVARLTAEADPLLRGQGVAPGPIGPAHRFAGTAERPALREQRRRAARDARLYHGADDPAAGPDAGAVPVAACEPDGGAARAGRDRGRVGGRLCAGRESRGHATGIFYINLQDVHSRPRFTLPTLTAHEAIPGHLWQDAVVNSARDIPTLFRSTGISAFGEGWGLYAETLADELGFYATIRSAESA